MRFPVYFKRQKGAVVVDPAITTLGVGSDAVPTVATKGEIAGHDNVLVAKVAGIGNSIRRVAVGYWFSAGSGAALTATLWVFDRNSEKWFMASTGTLTDGQLTYFRVPYLADPPQTSANMSSPTSGGVEYMLSVADPGAGAANGVYHFVMGPDTGNF